MLRDSFWIRSSAPPRALGAQWRPNPGPISVLEEPQLWKGDRHLSAKRTDESK